MYYKVVKEYSDIPENPISITKGECLTKAEESDPNGDWPNWVYCRAQNKQGWVPKQILSINGDHVQALADYCAFEHRLGLDEILVAKQTLNGWIWCEKQLAKGRFGWAPLNHLQPVKN